MCTVKLKGIMVAFLRTYRKPGANMSMQEECSLIAKPNLSSGTAVMLLRFKFRGVNAHMHGHRGILYLVKGSLWGSCKLLLDHFKGTKAMIKGKGHWGNQAWHPFKQIVWTKRDKMFKVFLGTELLFFQKVSRLKKSSPPCYLSWCKLMPSNSRQNEVCRWHSKTLSLLTLGVNFNDRSCRVLAGDFFQYVWHSAKIARHV